MNEYDPNDNNEYDPNRNNVSFDGHDFHQIHNYGIPTGYYVCSNVKCDYSIVGGDWKWWDPTAGLMYVLDECPSPIERPIRWKVGYDLEVLFIREPQSPSDDPDSHA